MYLGRQIVNELSKQEAGVRAARPDRHDDVVDSQFAFPQLLADFLRRSNIAKRPNVI